MLKVIVIDDEANAVALISGVLKRHCNNVSLVATASNVATGIAAIHLHNPDIVFLDIKMPDGTGFDLLKKVHELNFKVIFITAYQEFAVQAFKFSALDYLLKPFESEELIAAVARAEEYLQYKNISLNLSAFYENINSKFAEPKKLVLKTADHIYAVSIKDIIRCESEGNYTIFIINDGRKLMVSRILKEYDDLLSGYNFFRVHQSHLINMHYFESYKKTDGGSVVLTDKSCIPVSHRKKDEFLKLLSSL